MDKKLTSLIDIKKSEFDEFIQSGQIKSISNARLIPTSKFGDESSLTSVFLSGLRLIKEFKNVLLNDIKMSKGGEIFAYTEIAFSEFPDSRVDGLLLVVKAGVIKDAAFFEMKKGGNILEVDQVQRYIDIAKHFNVPRLVTISNEFVSDPTQHPLCLKPTKNFGLYHFSWTYILTVSHLLLQRNDLNISDEDQVEIMKEIVSYFEAEKSGVCEFNQMKQGWTKVVDNINAGTLIKSSDTDSVDAVVSWQQAERNIALRLSRKLGVLVKSGESKFKGDYKARIDHDLKTLVEAKRLFSVLSVSGAISDIDVIANLEKRSVEIQVILDVPTDKTLKGQLGWVKKQLENCFHKSKELYEKSKSEIFIEAVVKNARQPIRIRLSDFEMLNDELKGKELKSCCILQVKDFGRLFGYPSKFVESIESMSEEFYVLVVENLKRWVPSAPKINTNIATEENLSSVEVVVKDASNLGEVENSVDQSRKNVA